MNNEPVAWMHKIYFPNGLYEEDLVWSKIDESSIPLYTHPADESFDRTASHMAGEYVSYPSKDLTDEEIIKVYENMLGVASARSSAIDFARAILRKAQEK